MVRRGEYLERSVVVPHGDSTLDGLYHRGARRRGLVVAPPHPDHGSMEIPLIAEVAWAAARAGYPTLRFDYPGVRGSPGAFSEWAARGALESAAEHLTASMADGFPLEGSALVFMGVRWGAEVVARAIDADPQAAGAVILVQPPMDAWPYLNRYPGPVRGILAGEDAEGHRSAAADAAAACSDARVTVVVEADRTFRRGLVQLGRAVVETLQGRL